MSEPTIHAVVPVMVRPSPTSVATNSAATVETRPTAPVSAFACFWVIDWNHGVRMLCRAANTSTATRNPEAVTSNPSTNSDAIHRPRAADARKMDGPDEEDDHARTRSFVGGGRRTAPGP